MSGIKIGDRFMYDGEPVTVDVSEEHSHMHRCRFPTRGYVWLSREYLNNARRLDAVPVSVTVAPAATTVDIPPGSRWKFVNTNSPPVVVRSVANGLVYYSYSDSPDLVFAWEVENFSALKHLDNVSPPPVDPWAEHLKREAKIAFEMATYDHNRYHGMYGRSDSSDRPVCGPPEPMSTGVGSMCRMTGTVNRRYR